MDIPGASSTGFHLCGYCHQPIPEQARYCPQCGASQHATGIDDVLKKQKTFTTLTIFFGVFLAVCLLGNFTRYGRGFTSLLVTDGILSLLTVVYIVIFWQDLKKLFRWTHFSILKLAAYTSTSVIAAVIINYAVKWLNKTIFDGDTYYYYAFSHLKYARLVTILVVALQPAIVEELAFRGVMQQGLNKVVDARQAIFISAFLFTLLHLSFITFFWLMPFAWWLGYVRMKEETIWYGVVIHFCFNATACLLEFFELDLF